MKNIYLLIILILFSNFLFSQTSFSHSIGASGFLGTRNATLHSIGIIYSPRLNLFEISESSTLSIGSNIGIGYNIDNTFVDGNQFTFHVPIIIGYNFGLASSKNAHANKSGGFFGIGYSFEQAGLNINNGNLLVKKTMMGPITNLGYRFKIGSEPFSIRASYLYGTGDFGGGYLTTLSIQYILK